MNIVIIGNGVAGIEAALVVANREPSWNVTIVSEESDHFFSRTALMWVVSGQLSHQCIEPLERDVYERMGFTRVRARATGVDAEKHEVSLTTGETLSFDRLLIACGSAPRRGPWPGSELDGVGHFVTLQDLEWLEKELHGGPSRGGRPPNPDAHLRPDMGDSPYAARKSLRESRGGPPKNPAIIGGGLIGIEAVEVCHAAGLHPRFFIREEWFWPIAIDKAESTWISDRMKAHGVDVRLEEDVKSIDGTSAIEGITTDVGSYKQDLVVIAIGVQPNTSWLEGSDIERQSRGGAILVNEHLQTHHPDVFAAGDCAAVRWFNGAVRPEQLWYTSRDQGRIAGRGLLGDTVSYARGQWYNSAKLFDIEYTTAGLVNMNVVDETNWFFEETGEVRSTNRIVMSGERVVGFNMLGRRWDHEVMLRFIEEHRSLQYVLEHLGEASFDTEFVPPLVIPSAARAGALQGPAPSGMPELVTPVQV